jgi:hypothetical protein
MKIERKRRFQKPAIVIPAPKGICKNKFGLSSSELHNFIQKYRLFFAIFSRVIMEESKKEILKRISQYLLTPPK